MNQEISFAVIVSEDEQQAKRQKYRPAERFSIIPESAAYSSAQQQPCN
jgi:hypothetical protein